MPGHTLLSFAHPLCLGTLSFAEGKIEYSTDLKRSLVCFFLQVTCLLTALQGAQARPPTEREAEEVLQRWSRAQPTPPPPGSNTVVIFTKQSLAKLSLFFFWKDNAWYQKKKRKETRLHTVRRCQVVRPRQTFSCSWKGTKISAQRDIGSHVSLSKLEKALKSVMRDAKLRVSPRKLEKLRLDRYRAFDHYRGVDRYSKSKLDPLTVVWPSTKAVHGPVKVFWTTYKAVNHYRAMDRHRVSHIILRPAGSDPRVGDGLPWNPLPMAIK